METTAGRRAVDALREFAGACCTSREDGAAPGGGGRAPALVLAMAPPSTLDECAHEDALDFAFADEVKVARQLQAQAAVGRALADDVYCARSCARAIPPAPDAEDPAATRDYYRAVYEVLYPQVAKIKRLSDYCSKTVLLLSDAIQRLTVHENAARIIPDALVDALLDVLDVMLQLSHLHNAKTSLRNDFSVFKRIYLNVKDRDEDAERMERDMVRLQEFAGCSSQPRGSIWAALQHNLANIKRFDQVAFLLLKRCVILLESTEREIPAIRFKHLRLASLLKSVLEDLDKTSKGKTIGIDRKLVESASKIGLRYPIVPIYAELSTKPPVSVASNPRSNKTCDQTGASMSKAYDIVAMSNDVKASCEGYLSKLFFLMNLSGQSKTAAVNDALYAALVDGIERMSDWKATFLLFHAYKQQAVETFGDLQPMRGGEEECSLDRYERAIQQSYSSDEWLAMASAIHCVKAVVQVMRRFIVQLVVCARRHVYSRIQGFVQCVLLPILHRSDKRNLACTKLLHDLRLCCGDWQNSSLLANDFKKRRKERKLPLVLDKTVGISQSQLQLIRTIVDAIYSKRSMAELNTKQSAASSLFSFKRDLDSADIELLCAFYSDSAAFPRVLALEDTLAELQDFSRLWFRELQLELTQAVQFPSTVSLPWLLMEHTLLHAADLGVEPLLSLLDVYNDAAHCSLFRFKKRFLYDEAVAEGSMVYDAVVHHVAEQVYLQEKSAVSPQMDPRQTSRHSSTDMKPGFDRSSLTRRLVNVFGVEQRFSSHVAALINAKVRKDLLAWAKKHERSDITSTAAMDRQLKIYWEVHRRLSYLELECFEDMLVQVLRCYPLEDPVTQAVGGSCRVQRLVTRTLLSSLCQRFSVDFQDEQFVQSVEHPALILESEYEDGKERWEPPQDNEEREQSSRRAGGARNGDERCEDHKVASFGVRHVKAISTMLRPPQVLQVADNCIGFVISKIEDVLSLCIPALGSAIPPYRLPRFMYRAEGCFGFFEGKFKHLLDSEELEAQVLHCFREIGNALMFLLLLDEERSTSAIAAPMPAQDKPPGMFLRALVRVREALTQSGIADEWHAPSNSCPESLTNSAAFYRVWCAIEFISCCHPRVGLTPDTTANRDLFGDGLQIAGCALIHLLEQRPLYELWNVSQHVLDASQCDQARSFSGSSDALPVSPRPAPSAIMASRNRWMKSKASGRSMNDVSASSSVGTLDQGMKEKARAFLASAQSMRTTSSRIFHMLERFCPTGSDQDTDTKTRSPFSPPAFVPPTSDELP